MGVVDPLCNDMDFMERDKPEVTVVVPLPLFTVVLFVRMVGFVFFLLPPTPTTGGLFKKRGMFYSVWMK
jgi:hypothetical protein